MSKRPIAPGDEWVGALVPLPSFVTGEGAPYRPVAVMWVDAASLFIVDAEVVHPDEAHARAAALFVRATRQPKQSPPHTPARLRVSDKALAAALRGSIGDVELVVAPTPETVQIAKDMTGHLSDPRHASPESQSFIGPDMTASDVAVMFAAAARLYRAAPWSVVPPDVCIGVSCSVLGLVDGAMFVVGQLGQSFGFSLFASLDQAAAFHEAARANDRGETPVFPRHIMFGFDARNELSARTVREIAKHGWEVADHSAYPSPLAIEEDRVARDLTRVEMLGVSAIMTALAELVETEPKLAEAWDRDGAAIARARTIDTPLGEVSVELRAPVAMPFASSIAGAHDLADEDELDEYAAVLVDELAELPGIHDMHLRCADMLIANAGRVFGVPLLRIDPHALHQLIFEYIPANVAVDQDVAPFTIEAARYLFAIGAERLEIETAAECVGSLAAPELTARLASALADPSRYSPAKAMVMDGIRAGYDLTSEQGVAAWVEELSRRARPKPRKKSPAKPKPAKPKPAKPKPKPTKKKPAARPKQRR